VRDAVTAVLGQPTFRERARELQAAYAAAPGVQRAAEAVLEVAGARQPVA